MDFHPGRARSLLERRVQSLSAQAESELGLSLPRIGVRTDLRGLAAGRCRIRRGGRGIRVEVRFNVRTLEDAWLLEDAWRETAPHEVAHAAIAVWAWLKGRRVQPHGREWRTLCLALGGSARTTHALPLQRARRRREFEYLMDDGERVWLGPTRHKRLQSGRASYRFRGRPVRSSAHTGRSRTRR